jgi:plasmid stability protein
MCRAELGASHTPIALSLYYCSAAHRAGRIATAQVLIRDLNPEVVEKLEVRSRRNQRSLEAELRVVLAEAVREPSFAMRDEVHRVRAQFEGRLFTDSVALLREDRER